MRHTQWRPHVLNSCASLPGSHRPGSFARMFGQRDQRPGVRMPAHRCAGKHAPAGAHLDGLDVQAGGGAAAGGPPVRAGAAHNHPVRAVGAVLLEPLLLVVLRAALLVRRPARASPRASTPLRLRTVLRAPMCAEKHELTCPSDTPSHWRHKGSQYLSFWQRFSRHCAADGSS